MSSFNVVPPAGLPACGCFPSSHVDALAPFAVQAAARVTGRRVPLSARTAVDTVAPEGDPLVEAQAERALGVLVAVTRCEQHRPKAAKASPAAAGRVSAAAVAYLSSDDAHRPTTGRDLLQVLSWAIGDHNRDLTRDTPATSRPDRKGRQLRRRDGVTRLLTEPQAELFVILSRGVKRARSHLLVDSGERLAAEIILRSCEDRDALAYVRRVSERQRRGPLAASDGVLSAVPDAVLLDEIRGFTDPQTWRGGDPVAQETWWWLVTTAQTILGTSLDQDSVADARVREVSGRSVFDHAPSPASHTQAEFTPDIELEILLRANRTGHLGPRVFTAKESAMLRARIEQLQHMGVSE